MRNQLRGRLRMCLSSKGCHPFWRFLFTFVISLSFVAESFALIPDGYYDIPEGKNSSQLKTAFFNIIKGHTVLTYSDLWQAFKKTDIKPNGRVWDVYSNTTDFDFDKDRDSGSGGTSEGGVYNREHSFPKSWFGGDVIPMYTDLFHMYPSDKWVNNKRGNLPFGNVQVVTGFSANHYSEWGTSTESGASLTVFEPADELKGDFARTYFYMVTRYEDQVASWKSNPNTEMLDGTAYPALSQWAQKVLLKWAKDDPVSAKEIARNDSIYKLYQHNRNPYIDFKSLPDYIWGDSVNYAFYPSKYIPTGLKEINQGEKLQAWVKDGEVVVSTAKNKQITIYDITGRVLEKKISEGEITRFSVNKKQIIIINCETSKVKVLL